MLLRGFGFVLDPSEGLLHALEVVGVAVAHAAGELAEKVHDPELAPVFERLRHATAAVFGLDAISPAGDREARVGDVPRQLLARLGGDDRSCGAPPSPPDAVTAFELHARRRR